jgi:O-antigen/teichoic acid export membrane protein
MVIGYTLTFWGYIPTNYSVALQIFPLVVIATIFDGMSQLYNNFVMLSEKTWVSLVMTCFLGLLMFILNRVFVPIYGLNGTISILIFLSVLKYFVLYFFAKYQVKGEQTIQI